MRFVFGNRDMGGLKLSSVIPKRRKGRPKRKISASEKRAIVAQRKARAVRDRERLEKVTLAGKGAIHKVASAIQTAKRKSKLESKLRKSEAKARNEAPKRSTTSRYKKKGYSSNDEWY